MAEEKLVKADGLEDAIIGVGSRINMPEVLIYSYNKCVDIFMKRDGMTHEEAIEWMEYNVVGAWWGETTPIFVHEVPSDLDIDEFLEELGFEQPVNDNGLQN
jgi:hypothetical protein